MGRPVVIVTGGGGFIGRPTVSELISNNCDVHLIGISDPDIRGAHFHQCDLFDFIGIENILTEIKPTILLHLAWTVQPGKFWTDPKNCDWTAASLVLFRQFIEAGGQRVIGIGSCAEYGWGPSPLSEGRSQIEPATLYGCAKASTWAVLEALCRQEGISASWARLFFIYGPSESRGKLVSDAINMLLNNRSFETTSGIQRRDYIHVKDAAKAIALLTLSSIEGPVNIASGRSVPIKDILHQISELCDGQGRVILGARAINPNDPMDIEADVTRLYQEVGFQPTHTLEAGLKETVEWWKDAIKGKAAKSL